MNDAERIGTAFLSLLQAMEKTPRAVKFRVWYNYGRLPRDVPCKNPDPKGLTFDVLVHDTWPSSQAFLVGIWDGTMLGGRIVLNQDLDPAELAPILEKADAALRNTIKKLEERDKENKK